MAGLPESVLRKASSRENKLKPALSFTPPWQEMHLVLRMGRISALKSTEAAGCRVQAK
jgi:hypothetical protein